MLVQQRGDSRSQETQRWTRIWIVDTKFSLLFHSFPWVSMPPAIHPPPDLLAAKHSPRVACFHTFALSAGCLTVAPRSTWQDLLCHRPRPRPRTPSRRCHPPPWDYRCRMLNGSSAPSTSIVATSTSALQWPAVRHWLAVHLRRTGV